MVFGPSMRWYGVFISMVSTMPCLYTLFANWTSNMVSVCYLRFESRASLELYKSCNIVVNYWIVKLWCDCDRNWNISFVQRYAIIVNWWWYTLVPYLFANKMVKNVFYCLVVTMHCIKSIFEINSENLCYILQFECKRIWSRTTKCSSARCI